MVSKDFRFKCSVCLVESVHAEEYAFCGSDGFTCIACDEKEQEERKKMHLARSPIERELVRRGYGSIEGYAIIPCIKVDDEPEAVEFDTPGTNYWDVVNYGKVVKTVRTNLEDAFQLYLDCGKAGIPKPIRSL